MIARFEQRQTVGVGGWDPRRTLGSPRRESGRGDGPRRGLARVRRALTTGLFRELSLATGQLVWARQITPDPVHEKIASALNLNGPDVVAVTGGYDGDIPPYEGRVVTLQRSTGRIIHVWNSECSDRHRLIRAASCPVTNTRGDNAMWGGAGAVIEPGSGQILTATGNGPFDGQTSWGDSVLELSPDAAHLLHNWTPTVGPSLTAATSTSVRLLRRSCPPSTAAGSRSRAERTVGCTCSTSPG